MNWLLSLCLQLTVFIVTVLMRVYQLLDVNKLSKDIENSILLQLVCFLGAFTLGLTLGLTLW
jgi:hypothetical protein